MVSGFFTSPYDHARIISGEASPILIESKCSTGACCLNSFSKSFIEKYLREGPHLRACARGFKRGRSGPVRIPVPLVLFELHVDAERADFLHENVEGLRH